MYARDTARFLFEIHDGIAALRNPIAHVELNDDFLFGAVEKGVPRHLAIDRRELDVVVVVTNAHPVRLHFVGQLTEMSAASSQP